MKTSRKIREYIKDYKFNSLFFRNMRLLLLLIIVPLTGAVLLTYYAYNNMLRNDIRAYNEQVTASVYDDMERILKEAQTELIYIGFNSNVELYMYDTEEIRELNYRISSIQELIRLPIISKDYIRSIYLYAFKNQKVISVAGISDYETFQQRDCLDAYLENQDGYGKIMVTTGTEHGYEERQLSVYQPIRYGAAQEGLAVMNLDLDILREEFHIPGQEIVFLTDGDQILYSNQVEWIGGKAAEIPGIETVIRDGTFLSSEYSISCKTSAKEPLEVITYLGAGKYQNQLSAIKYSMMAFLGIMLVVTLGVSAFISVRIFRPIEEIMVAIRKNQGDLLGEHELFEEKDELEYILHTIQKTVNLKKDVDEELAERVRLLKKAQAVALQSQINPHFINNTLDTINWMAIGLLGGKNEISEMTGALSRMLRMSLENTDSIIPLSQEIEHCKCYLDIQNIRYEDRFRVIWDIPEELYRYRTIRVVLQPVVENAIYHGIKHLSNRGIITISGSIQEGMVELSVEDNGLGMTNQELENLREDMDSMRIKESRHIGLTNVNQRLRLYFGDDAGIRLECEEGRGTRVFIRFPGISDTEDQDYRHE